MAAEMEREGPKSAAFVEGWAEQSRETSVLLKQVMEPGRGVLPQGLRGGDVLAEQGGPRDVLSSFCSIHALSNINFISLFYFVFFRKKIFYHSYINTLYNYLPKANYIML